MFSSRVCVRVYQLAKYLIKHWTYFNATSMKLILSVPLQLNSFSCQHNLKANYYQSTQKWLQISEA